MRLTRPKTRWLTIGSVVLAGVAAVPLLAQEKRAKAGPEATEVWTPVPPVVTPGAAVSPGPPSDAVVLFDGSTLDGWVKAGTDKPAGWTVVDGTMKVNKKGGNIETKRRFADYQLHLEYQIPTDITGTGQARGNSGVFLASTGGGDAGYELQVLDNFENKTYVNGMAGSLYKQSIPLANACRKPGEWQSYDVAWDGPPVQAGRVAPVAGVRHRLPQRRLGREPLRAQGRDGLRRRAQVRQGIRVRPDQAPGPRRRQPADQLPQHLGPRTGPGREMSQCDLGNTLGLCRCGPLSGSRPEEISHR